MLNPQQSVDEYFAAISAMEIQRYLNVFAADGTCEDPVGSPARQGHPALKALITGLLSGFQSVELKPEWSFHTPYSAVVKWNGRCVAKNGKGATFNGIDVFRFDNEGKIRELVGHWDAGKLMAQLG